MAYIPVGDEPKYVSDSGVGLVTAGTVNAYTQTFATPSTTVPAAPSAVALTVAADAPAGGTGANAGGWDTAANRNIAITTINEIKTLQEAMVVEHAALIADVLALKKVFTALIDDVPQGWGLGKPALPYFPVGMPIARAQHTGIVTPLTVRPYTQTYSTAARTVPAATYAAVSATVAADAPAGGTGAAAGCYDTAGNRNTARTTINEERALALAFKTKQDLLEADVLALAQVANALIEDWVEVGMASV
jgi:hypothetical protein